MHKQEALPLLTIVPAGAGSGKTYFIQKQLTDWIREGRLAPEKIVAVTFTESAAAELKGRIRAALVHDALLEDALKLDHAYISTIHSFGLRLITEFAFDAGLSPAPRKLNDDEEEMLVSRALATSQSAGGIMENLERDGYRNDYYRTQENAEESFRTKMLSLIGTLRAIGKDTAAESLIAPAEKKIRELYGETRSAEHLKAALLHTVNTLLTAFPENISAQCTGSDTVRSTLHNDYRNIRHAARETPLDTDWKLWKKLRDLKYYKRALKVPAEYNDLVASVITAADELPFHPGPLQDALNHARAMLRAASETLASYVDDKRSRGLVDFNDMLSEAHKLLCTNPAVLAAFREQIDCLVVDEFQDTNPLQFSLLWALTRQGVPTIIVGDLKQAIMGFQNADARLLKELCRQNPVETAPLTGNYRSSKPLMEWINLIGTGLFGQDYTKLEPHAAYSSRLTSPLEVIEATRTLKTNVCATWTVARLVELLQNDEPQEIFDKSINSHRSLRGGDIALLCPTNRRLLAYAEALRKAGLRCKLEEDGWFESRIVQIVWYCLSYVADTDDRHAALYLAVTELGSHTLQSALTQLMNSQRITDPLLDKLGSLIAAQIEKPVDAVLCDVVEMLDLYGIISGWPDGVQARANLLRLQEECLEFMNGNREAMACGGYYGSEIKTFQAWLKGRIERDNLQPEASVIDDEAIQLMTWHKAKGREWPLVAVCGLDIECTPRIPTKRVVYEDFNNLDTILDNARIEIFPEFIAPETNARFIEDLLPETMESARRLLYVALTRAREKVILEWPAYKLENEVSSYLTELVSAANIKLIGNNMVVNDHAAACRIMKITDNEAVEFAAHKACSQLPEIGRRAIKLQPLPLDLTPESISPSSLHNAVCTISGEPEEQQYGDALTLSFTGIADPMEKGKILHRAFEVLSSHPERAGMLADAVGYPIKPEQASIIAAAVSAFDLWLATNFNPQVIETEIPLLTIDSMGSIVSGTADMILETHKGLWIIDHKSDQVPSVTLRHERFNTYYPQLKCYADALKTARPEKPVKGIIINWVSFGIVAVMELQ